MNITIIAPFSFGYIDSLADKLSEKRGVKVTFIQTSEIKFKYSSLFQRVSNFFLKTFLKRNLKQEFKSRHISKIFHRLPKQDVVLVIRPDQLEKTLLKELMTGSQRMISYYFDGIENFPEKIALIPFFDKVYSYEKRDVKNFRLRFITNFIPEDNFNSKKDARGAFNISSYDERYPILESLAAQFKELKYPFRIIVRKEKPVKAENVEVVKDYLSLEEVRTYMEDAAILLDIQKDNQEGLTFRVFESLGYEKKLITTNRDIATYDFYNPKNILIIDKENIQIPAAFLNEPYQPVAKEIVDKYRRDAWIKEVFENL